MRTALMLAAIAFTVACSSGDSGNNNSPAGSMVGKWALQSYNGNALPFTGSTNANGSVNRVDSGSITFDAKKTYVLDIRISNTLGSVVTPQDFAEVGSYGGTPATGVILKPNDLSGGTSNQNFAQVPVTVSDKTLSFPQQGKVLIFVKQ